MGLKNFLIDAVGKDVFDQAIREYHDFKEGNAADHRVIAETLIKISKQLEKIQQQLNKINKTK